MNLHWKYCSIFNEFFTAGKHYETDSTWCIPTHEINSTWCTLTHGGLSNDTKSTQQEILWFQRRFGRSHMTNKTNKPPSFVDTLYISLYQTLYPDRVKRKSTSHGLSESAGHLMVESLHTHENYLMCSCTTIWKGFYLVWWSCFSSSCASLGLVAIFKCC